MDRDLDTEYVLYSVLVHSGGSFGGHYYAYIRPNNGNQWMKFNDSLVSEVHKKEVLQVLALLLMNRVRVRVRARIAGAGLDLGKGSPSAFQGVRFRYLLYLDPGWPKGRPANRRQPTSIGQMSTPSINHQPPAITRHRRHFHPKRERFTSLLTPPPPQQTDPCTSTH